MVSLISWKQFHWQGYILKTSCWQCMPLSRNVVFSSSEVTVIIFDHTATSKVNVSEFERHAYVCVCSSIHMRNYLECVDWLSSQLTVTSPSSLPCSYTLRNLIHLPTPSSVKVQWWEHGFSLHVVSKGEGNPQQNVFILQSNISRGRSEVELSDPMLSDSYYFPGSFFLGRILVTTKHTFLRFSSVTSATACIFPVHKLIWIDSKHRAALKCNVYIYSCPFTKDCEFFNDLKYIFDSFSWPIVLSHHLHILLTIDFMQNLQTNDKLLFLIF